MNSFNLLLAASAFIFCLETENETKEFKILIASLKKKNTKLLVDKQGYSFKNIPV